MSPMGHGMLVAVLAQTRFPSTAARVDRMSDDGRDDGIVVASGPSRRRAIVAEGDGAGPRHPTARRRRAKRGRQLCDDGPSCVVALVGRTDHPLAHSRKCRGAQPFLRTVDEVLRDTTGGSMHDSQERWANLQLAIVGIAVVVCWRFQRDDDEIARAVLGPSLGMAMWTAMGAIHRRAIRVRGYDIPVLASARFKELVRVDRVNAEQLAWLTDKPSGISAMAEVMRHLEVVLTKVGDGHDHVGLDIGQDLRFPDLMCKWKRQFSLVELSSTPVALQLWGPVADVASHGRLDFAVAPIGHLSSQYPRLPLHVPPARLVRELARQPVAAVVPPEARTVEAKSYSVTRTAWRGKESIKCYSAQHLIRAVRVCTRLTSKRNLKVTIDDVTEFRFPGHIADLRALDDSGDFEYPSADTVRRAMLRMDVACMMVMRRYNRMFQGVRHLMYDASPKAGYEIYAMRETRVEFDVAAGAVVASAVQKRYLPLLCLGQGHVSAIDKTVRLVHVAFLEAGPSIDALRTWCSEVRTGLSDLGVEYMCIDSPDILETYLKSGGSVTQADVRASAGTFLFPRAFAVPGINHLIDWLVSDAHKQMDFWPSLQRCAKSVCHSVRSAGFRDVLQSILRSKGRGDLAAQLEHWSANFAKWRWQTLHTVNEALLTSWEALKESLSPEAVADDEDRKHVTEALRQVDFLDWVRASHFLTTRASEFRGWAMGCACHEQQCIAAARSGQTFSCSFKSMRCVELLGKVDAIRAELGEARRKVAERGITSAIVARALHTGLSRFIAMFELKFKWVSMLPWSIWQFHDRAACVRARQEYRDAMAGGPLSAAKVHRVCHRFFAAEGDLFEQTNRYCDGGPMGEHLEREVVAYSSAVLDETPSEGVHARVQRFSTVATSSTPVAWSNTLRLNENLDFYFKEVSRDGGVYFHSCFDHPKAILQRSRIAWRHLRGVRMTSKQFVRAVYKNREACLEDWSVFAGTMSYPAPFNGPSGLSEIVHIRKDYYAAVLSGRRIYALPQMPSEQDPSDLPPPLALPAPEVSHQGASSAAEFALVPHHPPGAGGPSEGWLFFEVVDIAPGRKKLPYSMNMQRRVFPVMVQKYEVLRIDALHMDLNRLDQSVPVAIFASGFPEIVDIAAMSPWLTFVSKLVAWDTIEPSSEVAGCLVVSTPRLAQNVTFDYMKLEYPVYLMLKQLRSAGWRLGKRQQPHELTDGDMRVDDRRLSTRKSYLRCLLRLLDLIARGLQRLPAIGTEFFYRAVLSSADPSAVQPGRTVREYKALMNGERPDVVVPALELLDMDGGAVAGELADAELVALEDAPGEGRGLGNTPASAALGDEGITVCASLMGPAVGARGTGAPAALAASQSVTVLADADDFMLAPAMAVPVPAGASSASSSMAAAGGSESVGDVLVVRDLAMTPFESTFDLPTHIGGHRLHIERYGETGDKQQRYLRLIVYCQCDRHKESGMQCKKFRSIGPRTMDLGKMGCVAFLGAWLAAADRFASRREHVVYRPAKAEVEQYMSAQGWAT